MATVGFLGLGTMGFAMAMRLVEAGHDVVVWNRSPDPVARAVARGAQAAADPAQALAADVSFSMFANDQAADTVLSPEVLESGRGGIHANMASVSPAIAQILDSRSQAAGVTYLASPVLGRPPVAEAGQLNILAAGPEEAINQVEPFYALMGVRTWRLGDRAETANLVKIAVNYNIIHAIQAIAESVALVERSGVAAKDFTDLLAHTLFGGVVYSGYGDLIARADYLPQAFSMELGKKDLHLASDSAARVDLTLPTAHVLSELFDQALARPELAQLDWAALAEVTRQNEVSHEK
jgi:3-hydroxyisobutyrate dehydrogenase-like beta-hydroxyacid dehydrogenase